jgi:exocyst complex component 3
MHHVGSGYVAQLDAMHHVGSLFSQDLTFKALLLSMDQVTQYGKMYRDAIIEFKIRHFEDRSKVMLASVKCMLHI